MDVPFVNIYAILVSVRVCSHHKEHTHDHTAGGSIPNCENSPIHSSSFLPKLTGSDCTGEKEIWDFEAKYKKKEEGIPM